MHQISRQLHTVSTSEVTTLQHELGNHTMEFAALEPKALFVCTEGAEVFSSLGNHVVEEVEVDAALLGLDSTDVGDVALWVDGEFGSFPAGMSVSW